MKFWMYFVSLLVALSVVVAGLWWGVGPLMALFLTIGFLLVLLVIQWQRLYRLQNWLHSGNIADVPECRGVWGEIFATLYHVLRNQEQRQQTLKRELDHFHEAVGALPDGVIILDQERRIEWLNNVAAEQYGINFKRDMGTPVVQLIRQPDFIALIENERAESVLIKGRGAGVERYAVSTSPFGGSGMIVLSRDVTQSNKVQIIRRDFVANVSHELRTPLTVIVGLLEHLMDDPAMDGAVRARFLSMVQEQSGRMHRLVDDLLTLSTLEATQEPAEEELVNVPFLLKSLVEDGRAFSQGKHLITLSTMDVVIKGSARELRSAFGNLITNAIRYTPDGGEIRVSCEVENGSLIITVADSGIGIPAEHLPRLTERFYRVDKGRSASTGGTGLGLAIVKHALQHHQAILDIRSTMGQGSEFRAVFPPVRFAHQCALT